MIRTTKTEAKKWLANLTANVKKANAKNARSAWRRGVGEYAIELIDNLEYMTDNGEIPTTAEELKKALLNGAENWKEYSEGGCSLVYDCDIAERLCTPSELKRTDNGRLNPNSRESWIDCQTRALCQAYSGIRFAFMYAGAKFSL